MPTTWIISLAIEPFASTILAPAYLDPGTGSYALQMLLAGAFGGLFALKQSWQQVRAWWASGPFGRRVPAPEGRNWD